MKLTALRFEKKESVAVVSLNRPSAQNRINNRMTEELSDLLALIQEDDGIRVWLLTAEGSTNFSLGAELPEHGHTASDDIFMRISIASVVARSRKPSIAVVNGAAIGQGLELVLACDLRVCSETAKFAMPQLSAGQIPWDGGTQRLPRLVGRSRALQIILTGETVDAWGALRIGLVNRVIQTSMLQATALDMAQSVSRMAPIAAEFAKEAILSGMELPLAHALRLETDLYFLLQNTIDRKEGIWAHREKRTPRFEGR